MARHDQARARLAEWEAFKPSNFYHDDRRLQAVLAVRMGADRLREAASVLEQAGADPAEGLRELDPPEHLPRLESWSSIGERTSEDPAYPELVTRLVQP